MPNSKPLPIAVAALLAVIRRNSLLDANSLHRLRLRLVRDEIADLPSLRRWLKEGDVNRRVGQALLKLLPVRDDQRIGDSHVLAHLADGGMGSVDLVELGGVLRVCKTVKAGQQSQNVAKRFRREAAITATFDHPHLVRCFAHGQDGERLFLILEWVPGGDAQQLVEAGGPLSIADTLSLMHQSSLGLAHAHSLQLVHRDIKPANLLVTEAGTIRVADFGLARSTSEDDSWMTAAGATVGTPSYMPPEQIRGQDLDARADLYALGCVLHFCLTGHPPWSGTIADVLRGHLDMEPPSPALRRHDVPQDLLKLHNDLLAKLPKQRPANATVIAKRTADMLRGVQRDPGDGLSPRAVAQSTSRHVVPAAVHQQDTVSDFPGESQPSDPTTRRISRKDTQPPANLADALTDIRLHLSATAAHESSIVATLFAGDELSLGREADVLVGSHPDIGRIHCHLIRYDDTPAVIDHGSVNGTWLDERWLPHDRAQLLSADREHRLRFGADTTLALRAVAQRTAPIPDLGPDGLGSGAGWDAVILPAAAWVLRRLTIGPTGSDLPIAAWQGPALEIARWGNAWVWQQNGMGWQGLVAGPLGRSGMAVSSSTSSGSDL